VGTNVCVESTVRGAFTHDVPVPVVSDATATLTKEEHEASLKSMRFFGQVADMAEIERELAEGGT
jgi:ureidoacrylate peracid hydrolase